MKPLPVLCLLALACAPPPPASQPVPAPPVPIVKLQGSDWVIVDEDATQLVLRYRDTSDGVRINLTTTAQGRRPGVALIEGGRTTELRGAQHIEPLFGVAVPDAALTEVILEPQGPDLLIRMAGPALSGLTDDSEAPDDPVLSWVRLRHRGADWRIVLQGLHRWTLPAQDLSVVEYGDHRVVRSAWGAFTLDDQAPASTSVLTAERWLWDSRPSLDLRQPYPRLGMTWTPERP